MKTNNWMLAFATVISLLILMKVTEKDPSKNRVGVVNKNFFLFYTKSLEEIVQYF